MLYTFFWVIPQRLNFICLHVVNSIRKGVPGINLKHAVKTCGGSGCITPRFKLDVRGSVHLSIIHTKKIQQDPTVYQNFISYLNEAQQLRAFNNYTFNNYTSNNYTSNNYTSNNPPRMQNQKLLVQF